MKQKQSKTKLKNTSIELKRKAQDKSKLDIKSYERKIKIVAKTNSVGLKQIKQEKGQNWKLKQIKKQAKKNNKE